MNYPIPSDEDKRLQFLQELSILDSARDETLDRITRLCQLIYSVPISTVSLIDEDRQWFKSFQGLDVCETDRELAFCNYTILGDEIFEITDAATHPDFMDNALVTGDPNIRYYAGAPLIYDGFNIGALCLIDTSVREPLDTAGRETLTELSKLVVHEFKTTRLLRRAVASLANRG